MQCSEIVRELAVPTRAVDAATVERHLAACPVCARRAEEERRFDRLWDATRPAEPVPSTFEALWSRVEAAIEMPVGNGRLTSEPQILSVVGSSSVPQGWSRGRLGIVLAIGLAQAASILLTALIVSRMNTNGDAPIVADGPEVAATSENPKPPPELDADSGSPAERAEPQLVFVLEEGQTLVFRIDDNRGGPIEVHPRLIDLANDLVAFEGDLGDPIAVAGDKLDINVLNAMEGLGDLAFFPDDEPGANSPRGGAGEDGASRDASDSTPGASALFPSSPIGLRERVLTALIGLTPLYAEPGERFRQVTVFGIVATPDEDALDPQLDMIAEDLRKLKPGHGFLMRAVSSRRLASGESLVCDLGDGTIARAVLEDALDPASGKLRIRFTMEVDGRGAFTTTVTASPNQVFFCDAPIGDDVRLLIGIGAR